MQSLDFALVRVPAQSLDVAYSPQRQIVPLFEEGLYLASPEFWAELQKPGKETGRIGAKRALSFDKYWIRSASRCTPYGTFAGCARVGLDEGPTRIVLNENPEHVRRVRLDMNYLAEIIRAIARLEPVSRLVRLYTNNTAYTLPDAVRYVEYTLSGGMRKYHLSSASRTTYQDALLQRAQAGATIDELADCLLGIEDVSRQEAIAYITEIWRAQLLVPELEPCVTGHDNLARLIGQLSGYGVADTLVEALREVHALVTHPKGDVSHYKAIEDRLRSLNLAIEAPKNVFQTDLFLSLRSANIQRETIERIGHRVADLLVFTRPTRSAPLDHFKKRFYSRYDDREVPLLLALDPDYGIGYTEGLEEIAGENEIVEQLGIAAESAPENNRYRPIQQYILGKYVDHLREGKTCIEVTEGELAKLASGGMAPKIPESFFIMGSLLDGDGLVFDLQGMGGPSGATLLGRFAYGDDRLLEDIGRTLRAEEAVVPEAIHAEIVHLPDARIGNVLLRPLLRDYEIPYAGQSGSDRQIRPDDLYVSIRNDEIVLRSASLNRRIIPRLTTAHNYTGHSLPVYNFLCSLQAQGLNNTLHWDWGQLQTLRSLPRVVYKDIIVQKATWRVTEPDLAEWPAFRQRYQVPQRVVYQEGDNQLLLDLDEARGMALLTHYVKKVKTVTLAEFLFTPENCVVRDKTGRPFTNELVVPFRREPAPRPVAPMVKFTPGTLQRKFPPFSQWLYIKLYCGFKTAERILQDILLPFVEEGMREGAFEQFFFVRYHDEFPHLRIRFLNSDQNRQPVLYRKLLEKLQPCLDDESIDKVIVDTYARELERYGAPWMECSERLFFHDSLAVLRFINLLEEGEADKYKLLFAIRMIDAFLDDAGLTLPDKHELARGIQSGFFNEFGGQPGLRKKLNEKYRKYQSALFSHMDPSADASNGIVEAVDVFRERSRVNAVVFAEMPPAPQSNLASYIHMTMNRLFLSNHRKHELVVYHFLEKYYASKRAMAGDFAIPGENA